MDGAHAIVIKLYCRYIIVRIRFVWSFNHAFQVKGYLNKPERYGRNFLFY